MLEKPKTVRIITLGCAKNEVDSEEIAGVLAQAGYAPDPTTPKPDLIVINTCGFLDSAKQESLEVIRKTIRSKGKARLVVAGCLVQRMGAELEQAAPGADAYVGVGRMADFAKFANPEAPAEDLTPPHHRWAEVGTRARSGRPWSAYLKISEGCDHRCTFCTIPSFRGGHQSKPLERILAEARHLAASGAVELNLIAQDVSQYGFDLYGKFTLPSLLHELESIEQVRWVRLLYLYPSRVTDELLDAMASCEKVLPYIDLPLQHVSSAVLRRMKRPWDGERYLRLFEKIRARLPGAALRTTFIVGFPGETEADFAELLRFVEEARLDRAGAFVFSRERGTPSFEMPDQVPSRVKKERFDRLMRAQQRVSLAINRGWEGRKLDVLVDSADADGFVGRSYRDAPEIDGLVLASGRATPGQIVEVEVTRGFEYDLHARKIGAESADELGPLRIPLRTFPSRAPL